jgi:hypothetical protein
MKLTGQDAIEYKVNHPEVELNKHSDPVEEERFDLSIDEAWDVCREDPSLIYVEIDDGENGMKKENKAIIDMYKFFIRAIAYDGVEKNSETESRVSDSNWLVTDKDPVSTGLNCFSDIPEILNHETGEYAPWFPSIEEYWQHLTDLHVEEISGEYREDSTGTLWYYDDDEGWFLVCGDGELVRSTFNSPDDVD